MAQRPNSAVLRFLNRLFENHKIAGLSDRQLLRRFAADRDEDAFTLLVRRHGGMVLGVCHRVLGNAADAEDAFQATFLVLARKSSSIGWHESVGNWLYGVALRVSSKMRSQRSRALAQETLVELKSTVEVPADPATAAVGRELALELDGALQSIPAKLRGPLVLCYLEGKSQQEAARELGLPPGSMSRHLARGLELLRERLASRNLLLSTDALAAVLARGVWRVLVERSLAETTTRAALCYTMGALAAGGAASVRVLTISQGVLRAMMFTQLKLAIGLIFAAGLLGTGGYLQIRQPGAGQLAGGSVGQPAEAGLETVAIAKPAIESQDQGPASGFAEKLRKHQQLQSKLDGPVVLDKGLDKMNFGDAKTFFEDRYGLIILARPANMFEQGVNVLESPVQLDKLAGVSTRDVLEMLAAQVGATCLIHPSFVEIVPPEGAQPEAWIAGERRIVPMVHANFQETSLDKALRELALETGITVVLDKGSYETVGAPTVTARFDGTRLDTAVELLANMCNMKAVALDRSLYITSVDKATGLTEERDARKKAHEKAEEKKQKEAEKAELKKQKA